MSSALTPAERSLRARLAGLTFAAKHDVREHMKRAQTASPGQLSYWEQQVDPHGALPELERHRRAQSARKAHMTRLALASSEGPPRSKAVVTTRESAPKGAPTTAANDRVEGTDHAAVVNHQRCLTMPCVTAICVCGRSIRWMRTDARYCSAACKQRAYRERRAVAS
jgi:hypothetical protein